MPADRPPNVEEYVAPDTVSRGYETDDVNSRTVYVLLAAVIALVAVLCGGLYWFHNRLLARRTPLDASLSAVAAKQAADAPPLQPQVGHESLDAWDLKKMRDGEDKVFAAIGWKVDDRTHRHAVPSAVIAMLQNAGPATRPAATQPEGGR